MKVLVPSIIQFRGDSTLWLFHTVRDKEQGQNKELDLHNRKQRVLIYVPWEYVYHPRMRVGNVFGHVCLSACLSVYLCVCLSVFLSVQAITFEMLDIETSFLVCRYILTISRSSLSIKVIESRSRSYEKK